MMHTIEGHALTNKELGVIKLGEEPAFAAPPRFGPLMTVRIRGGRTCCSQTVALSSVGAISSGGLGPTSLPTSPMS